MLFIRQTTLSGSLNLGHTREAFKTSIHPFFKIQQLGSEVKDVEGIYTALHNSLNHVSTLNGVSQATIYKGIYNSTLDPNIGGTFNM